MSTLNTGKQSVANPDFQFARSTDPLAWCTPRPVRPACKDQTRGTGRRADAIDTAHSTGLPGERLGAPSTGAVTATRNDDVTTARLGSWRDRSGRYVGIRDYGRVRVVEESSGACVERVACRVLNRTQLESIASCREGAASD